MKLSHCFFVLYVLAGVNSISMAQAPGSTQDPVYGFDPFLYNGRMYYFSPPPGTVGSQYLFDAFDPQGLLTIKGVTYKNLSLNYDIYNQQLIMEYRNSLGSPCLVAISDAWLQSFSLGGSYFETVSEINQDKSIYQVLGKGPAKVLYYRNRELLFDNMKTSKNYYFSVIRMKKYVQVEGKFTPIYTNRNFIKAFKPGVQNALKKYMRSNGINVKDASDKIMTNLINYCNTLPGL